MARSLLPRVWPYGVALLAVLVTAAIRAALQPILGHEAPMLLFVLPVMLASWYGGPGPGLMATALSIICGLFLFFPAGFSPSDLVTLALFTTVSGAISLFHQSRRRRIEQETQIYKEREATLRQAYEREHRVAEALQRMLLIEPRETHLPGMEVEAIYEAAWDEAKIGGDFYDAFALSDDKVALVVGDVSGKGLNAASRTAEIKFALRAFLREHPDPATTLNRLNNLVCDAQELDAWEYSTFIAVSLLIVNSKTGCGELTIAGTEPPLILRRHDTVHPADAFTAHALEYPGLPLCVNTKFRYETQSFQLSPEDVVFLLTDGLTEARRGKTFLGYDGVIELAKEAARQGTLHQMGEAILEGAKSFANGKLQDDACLLLARRVPVA